MITDCKMRRKKGAEAKKEQIKRKNIKKGKEMKEKSGKAKA